MYLVQLFYDNEYKVIISTGEKDKIEYRVKEENLLRWGL